MSSHEPALASYAREFGDGGADPSDALLMGMNMNSRNKLKSKKLMWVSLAALVVMMGALFLVSGANSNGQSTSGFGKVKELMMRGSASESGRTAPAPESGSDLDVIGDVRCPSGTYYSAKRCHSCPVGHYCANNRKTQCPAGKYQGSMRKSSCISARCGYYVPAPGASRQMMCRAGTYAPGVGSSRCTPVPKGHASSAGSCTANKCKKGHWQDCQGQPTCHPAPCGKYVTGLGWHMYRSCPVGTYQPSTGASQCLVTAAGSYAKVGYCNQRKCSPGFYQPRTRQGGCISASCGHYVPSSGATRQTKCGPGQWQPDRSQPSCIGIPDGHIATPNRCGIIRCRAGTYRSSTKPYKCLSVPCGHYTNTGGAMRPKKCPPGEYQNLGGQTGCKKAPPGHYPNANRCGLVKCSPGTYQNAAGQTGCKSTKCGDIAPVSGMANPRKCPAGQYQNQGRQTKCKACPAGHYQNVVGQCACKRCPAGYYQGHTGQRGCKPCACGQHVSSTGATKCVKCPSGTYQHRTGQSSCIKAPAGKYATGGTCSWTICPAGTYTPSSGMNKCIEAKCGEKVSAPGQTRATQCPAGQYQPLPGQTRCLSAPRGSYTNGRGKCQETLCPVGHYQPHPGRTSCIQTSCGHYVAIVGSEVQNPCGAGRWQNKKGQSSCKVAAVGHYVAGFGKCTESKCPAGHYSDCQGQDKCEAAPCGNFVSGTGKKNYTPCPAGTYQNSPGQSGCKQTPRGRWSKSGFCYPQFCDPGTYQDKTGQSSCKDTKCGHYVDYEGAVTPRRCPAGTYQDKVKKTGCLTTTRQDAPTPGTCYPKTKGGTCTKDVRIDNPGGDMAGQPKRASSAQECQNRCLATAGCNCWATDFPRVTVCWLKSRCMPKRGVSVRQSGSCTKKSTGCGWVLVARQTVSAGYFPRSVIRTGKLNANNPNALNFMNLDLIGQHKINGAYEFKLVWPRSRTFTKAQIWKQTSNPWLASERKVRGYQAVSAPYPRYHWGGLEWNGHVSMLDGSANHGWWFFAVGSFQQWSSGIPGPTAAVQQVELYIKSAKSCGGGGSGPGGKVVTLGSDVCIPAAGLVNVRIPKSGQLKGMTLTYKSGTIKYCGRNSPASCQGAWGIPGWNLGLNIYVVKNDARRTIMFPKHGTQNFVFGPGRKDLWWYHMSPYKYNSRTLVFNGPQQAVTAGEMIRLGTGEYLSLSQGNHAHKHDNFGQTCATVTLNYA